jgi:hypothetical protein
LRGLAASVAYTSKASDTGEQVAADGASARFIAGTQGADLVFAALIERMPRVWALSYDLHDIVRTRMARIVDIADWMRRTRCGLAGHAMVLTFEPHRMSLRCMNCGEKTPGWTIHAHG